jgi:hypothetical protein
VYIKNEKNTYLLLLFLSLKTLIAYFPFSILVNKHFASSYFAGSLTNSACSKCIGNESLFSILNNAQPTLPSFIFIPAINTDKSALGVG